MNSGDPKDQPFFIGGGETVRVYAGYSFSPSVFCSFLAISLDLVVLIMVTKGSWATKLAPDVVRCVLVAPAAEVSYKSLQNFCMPGEEILRS